MQDKFITTNTLALAWSTLLATKATKRTIPRAQEDLAIIFLIRFWAWCRAGLLSSHVGQVPLSSL